jgi:hypothetical protein
LSLAYFFYLISIGDIAAETMSPEERQVRVDEDYAPELEMDAPAVITFTTSVAAQAVNAFLHRLTGFMGPDRRSSEILIRFHDLETRTNRTPADTGCCCMQRKLWGSGDRRDFLGLVWTE